MAGTTGPMLHCLGHGRGCCFLHVQQTSLTPLGWSAGTPGGRTLFPKAVGMVPPSPNQQIAKGLGIGQWIARRSDYQAVTLKQGLYKVRRFALF
jgi:hypothetical protein